MKMNCHKMLGTVLTPVLPTLVNLGANTRHARISCDAFVDDGKKLETQLHGVECPQVATGDVEPCYTVLYVHTSFEHTDVAVMMDVEFCARCTAVSQRTPMCAACLAEINLSFTATPRFVAQ